ncbi:hypothetical protein TNCT_610051 [Trichonephila clavata]|uniref:Uncharacterized protein n=1 Tax=Trichonephila clavata TaxID=2740835 RepID=A0A8X6J6P8_TRICU|nr:hypothetical protein TNCT_610051 [Trichonephila clavata]
MHLLLIGSSFPGQNAKIKLFGPFHYNTTGTRAIVPTLLHQSDHRTLLAPEQSSQHYWHQSNRPNTTGIRATVPTLLASEQQSQHYWHQSNSHNTTGIRATVITLLASEQQS